MKQNHFNERIQSQLHDNSLAIKSLLDVLGRTVNDVKCLVKHFHMVQSQLDQISNVQKIFLLIMPNRIYRPSGLKPEEELVLKILSIRRGILRGSSRILKSRKKKLLALRRRRRITKKLTIPMIQIVYPLPMLRLK